MRELKIQGASYKDLAQMFDRPQNSIQIKFSELGWTGENLFNKDDEPVAEDKTEDTVTQDGHTIRRKPQLSDFQPREMIKYLYNMGYRIKNNKLMFIYEQVVNMKSILED